MVRPCDVDERRTHSEKNARPMWTCEGKEEEGGAWKEKKGTPKKDG